MSRRTTDEFSLGNDEQTWRDDPVARGPLRISGAVFGSDANWFVTTDRLGWSTVVLISDPSGTEDWDAAAALHRSAEAACEPVQTALAVRDVLRASSRARCREAGLAVARIGPHGRLVELVNVSLPTVLHWDPIEGVSPYEPMFVDLDAMTGDVTGEILRLRSGAALVMATSGVLSMDATWAELQSFTRALALDPLGGTIADAPPSELGRLLTTSWGMGEGPAGIVVAGLPSQVAQVA